MSSQRPQRSGQRLIELLADVLNVPASHVGLRASEGKEFDFVVEVEGNEFLVAQRSSGSLPAIAGAAQSLKSYLDSHSEDLSIPLVLVPYLGAVGREYCREADVNCLDLSGNAEIRALGLRVMVEGRPNRFKRPGPSVSAFAPKSSRVVRRLLLEPKRAFTQRELSASTGLDEGFVSRIVRRLDADLLVERTTDGRLRVADPGLLLDAWREQYKFGRHEVIKGHIPSPSPQALMASVAQAMEQAAPAQYAMTGLCAAWLYTHLASFRSVVLFASHASPERTLRSLGFEPGERGANLWLTIPNDDSPFEGSEDIEGIRCVSPVQAYLDLKEAGERSKEASERLKDHYLSGLHPGD